MKLRNLLSAISLAALLFGCQPPAQTSDARHELDSIRTVLNHRIDSLEAVTGTLSDSLEAMRIAQNMLMDSLAHASENQPKRPPFVARDLKNGDIKDGEDGPRKGGK